MKRTKLPLLAITCLMGSAFTWSLYQPNEESKLNHRNNRYSDESSQPAVQTSPDIQQTDNATTENSQRIQLALILDTSNSMDGLIDQAKSQLWNIVNELAKAERDTTEAKVEIALYEYGNDGLSISSGYIRQVVGFTDDLDDISEKLFNLKTNGGSEYCGKVISTSLKDLLWTESDSAFKVIYIAGNEPFTQGPLKYETACAQANQQNVVINTIFCGNFMEGARTKWQHGAELGRGTYMNIDSDKQTIQVATPYDNQILQLNTQLNNTYIHYGTKGVELKEKQVKQDENAGKYSSANTAKRAISKSSKIYKNTHWDLVDAYEKDKTVIKNIDKNTLPDDLKNASDSTLLKTVEANQKERIEIQKKISELGAQREEFIFQNAASDSLNQGTLGTSLVKTVRKQAVEKGFKFEK